MKIPTLKKSQICILNNEFVVIVDKFFNKEKQLHQYYVKKLTNYYTKGWHSYSYTRILYSYLTSTTFMLKDITFKNLKPDLTPLYLEYPELSL